MKAWHIYGAHLKPAASLKLHHFRTAAAAASVNLHAIRA